MHPLAPKGAFVENTAAGLRQDFPHLSPKEASYLAQEISRIITGLRRAGKKATSISLALRNTHPTRLSEELAQLRIASGLKMSTVASRMGWSQSTQCRFENGSSTPSKADLHLLAGLYGLSAEATEALVRLRLEA